MPSHLSSIGFPTETEDEFRAWGVLAAEHGETIECEGGVYYAWRAGGGAELWLQVHDDVILGVNPHFAGDASMRVGLTARVARDDESPLDGAFYGWAEPADGAESGQYPFVFDAPDARLQDDLVLPHVGRVQVAAFAHELRAFPDDDAFGAAEHTVKLAPEAFIPAGLFTGVESGPPRAHAVFAGHVVETALRQNGFSRAAFWWARVRTFGGELDVVADPVVLDGELRVGGVVSGAFWLSGRVLR